jgi:molybdopterin synthase catalytic subunit
MTLEHYPAMTEKALREIAGEAIERWRLVDAVVIHRVGTLQPCDQVVLVIAASAHRGDAFRACEFMIDTLKTRAPFWKRERTPAGERWVTARESDAQAATHWHADG